MRKLCIALLLLLLPALANAGAVCVGGPVCARTFSDIFFSTAEADFTVRDLATPTNTGGIRSFVTYSPVATSTGTVWGLYGKTTYSSSIDMANPGHMIGTLGHAVNSSASKTADLLIGSEGKIDNTAGTCTLCVGSLGVLTSNATSQTVTTWVGQGSQISTNAGTITTAIGFQAKIAANSGTIGTYAAFHVPTEGLTGITTRYAFLNEDADSVIQNASAFVSPGTATCADNGAGTAAALTLLPVTHVVALTNADANGCTVTMSETGMPAGKTQTTIVVVSNAGGTVDFADSAGVSETAGAFNAAVGDTITFVYTNSAWYEVGRSNN